MKIKIRKAFPVPNSLHVTWAANYLGCTVEKIIQFGANGDIDLLVNFDECDKPVYGYVADYTEQVPDDNWLVKLSGGLARYGEFETTNESDVVTARLGGVWCVYRLDLQENMLGKPREKTRLLARKDISDRGSSLDAEAKIIEIDNPFPDYWITREDFHLLEALCYVDSPVVITEPTEVLLKQVSSLVEKLRQSTEQSDILANLLQQSEDEITSLKVKVANPGYMDPLHPRYAPKLAALVHSWLAYEPNSRKSPKMVLSEWLKRHAEEFPSIDGKPLTGFDDLAAVANWSTKGGAPKTLFKK